MMDPVALAYSGRVEEAVASARQATRADEPYLVAQGLEAYAVLGQQHGWQADPASIEAIQRFAREGGSVGRNAWEAATALGVRAVEGLATAALEAGRPTWGILRFAGEWPSTALGTALERALGALDDLRDEALLALAVQPVTDRAADERRARLALEAAEDPRASVRQSAAVVLPVLAPGTCRDVLVRLSDDRDESVAQAAREALVRHASATLAWGRWIAPAKPG